MLRSYFELRLRRDSGSCLPSLDSGRSSTSIQVLRQRCNSKFKTAPADSNCKTANRVFRAMGTRLPQGTIECHCDVKARHFSRKGMSFFPSATHLTCRGKIRRATALTSRDHPHVTRQPRSRAFAFPSCLSLTKQTTNLETRKRKCRRHEVGIESYQAPELSGSSLVIRKLVGPPSRCH
jgi:hypothetical protein